MNDNDELEKIRAIMMAQQIIINEQEDMRKAELIKLIKIRVEYESLRDNLPDREDTPNQCGVCGIWYHPDDINYCWSACKNKYNVNGICNDCNTPSIKKCNPDNCHCLQKGRSCDICYT